MSLERRGTCVPITALKAFVWNGRNYVFQGQGPFFQVIDDNSGDFVAQTRLFRRNNVHGFIQLRSPESSKDSSRTRIIVWGGQSVRLVDFVAEPDSTVSLKISSAEYIAPDWIMNGCPANDDLPTTAYLITANNAPLKLDLHACDDSCDQMDIRISQMATSIKSILCAADLLAVSASHLLIAAGTIFGEIIVWSCFTEREDSSNLRFVGSIHHFFTGHDGTVFGVRLSPSIPSLKGEKPGRLLASCSDDRTVRIWDISDCEAKTSEHPSAYATDGFDLHSTGFGLDSTADAGNASESCVTKAFGHSARIWDIKFRPVKPDRSTIGLVTRGEDCTCVVWDLTWDSSSDVNNYRLIEKSSMKNHSGKHIWSFDLRSNSQETVVYSGGADGALKSLKIDETDNHSQEDSSAQQSPKDSDGVISFALVSQDHVIASTSEGNLKIGRISSDRAAKVTWETLCISENIQSPSIMAGLPSKSLAVMSDTQGRVGLYDHKSKSVSDLVSLGKRPIGLLCLESKADDSQRNEVFSFVVAYASYDMSTLITVSSWDSGSPKYDKLDFYLPGPRFEISSAAFAYNGEYLMLGSKLGGFAVYDVQNLDLSSKPLLIERRLHGSEGTNHIQTLSFSRDRELKDPEYVMTCGRDGKYCLHMLEIKGKQGEDLAVLETLHRTTSGLMGNIEGAFFDQSTGDFITYGFKMQEFVMRNESKQKDLVYVASGGPRRLWDLQPATIDGAGALLLWRDKGEFRTERIQMDKYRSLRVGVHGREIKTMDSLITPKETLSLFATGAEDTLVKIYAPLSADATGPWGSFECLRTLDIHTSGIQQVKWSNDGHYLFTSSAYEEFYAWRVRWVPSFGLATSLVATAPKSDPKSELRITSFDIITAHDPNGDLSYLIGMTLPNSTIKIFHFSPNAERKFTLLATGRYMTNCLTQCHFIQKESSISLITASTDGHITAWELTSVLEPFYDIGSFSLKSKKWPEQPEIKPAEIKCEDRFQIHSNSIKGTDLVSLSESETLILSGGDDNAFSVSVLKAHSEKLNLATVSIPDAHAASVTTVMAVDSSLEKTPTGFKTKAISSGNDHRVKLWSIELDLTTPEKTEIHAELNFDMYSSVADISSASLLPRINIGSSVRDSQVSPCTGPQKLVVCGVGIEIFELDI